MHAELGADCGGFRRNQRQRQALAYRVAVAAGGYKADHRAQSPDWLVAARIRIVRVAFKRDQLALGRRPLALRKRGLAAEKIAFVPGDPAIHAGHARRTILRELRRPDAEALLEPQRQKRVIAVLPNAKVPSRLDQGPA